jgi:MFS family permease
MSSSRRLTLAVAPAAMLAGLTPSLVFPVLGRIAAQQHVGTAAVAWVLTSAFLASAVATPIVGRSADLFGHQRVLLVTVTMVLAGSVIAATTLSFPVLIGGRVLQGTASALYPLVVSTLQDQVSGRHMTRSIAVVSGVMGAGGGVGFAVAGLLGNGSDYRAIFWFPVALSLAALVAGCAGVPSDRGRSRGGVDLPGCALLSGGLVLVLLPLSQGARWGFASPAILCCTGAGAVLLVMFGLAEKRASHPMVPLQLLYHRPILITNVLSVLVGVVAFLPLVVVPILIQSGPSIIGDGAPVSPLVTALVYLLPASLICIVGAPIGTQTIHRRGPRAAMTVVGMIALAGSAALVIAPAVPAILILGMFLTLTALYANYGALPLLIVPQVDRDDLGVANGVNSLARWIGSALVTAVAPLVLTVGSDGGPLTEPDFRWTFLIGVVASLGIVFMALFCLPSIRKANSSATAEPAATALSAPISQLNSCDLIDSRPASSCSANWNQLLPPLIRYWTLDTFMR